MKILKIGALWCPECLIMKPRWLAVLKEFFEIEVEEIDYDKNQEIKKQYQINHVPTYIFLDKAGQEILRLKGLVEKEELLRIIRENENK